MTAFKRRLHQFKENIWVDIAIVALAFSSVGLLVLELSVSLLPHQLTLMYSIDAIITFIFLIDVLAGLIVAPSWKFYVRHHWVDILASIPLPHNMIQSLQLLRILRVVRVVSRIRRLGVIADRLADDSSKYVYAGAVTATVILSASVSFFSMEYGVNPKLTHFFDAVWWAVVTATTVGYGDIYPVTTVGRLIGIILMFFGMGLVGTVAGIVSSHLMNRKKREHL